MQHLAGDPGIVGRRGGGASIPAASRTSRA